MYVIKPEVRLKGLIQWVSGNELIPIREREDIYPPMGKYLQEELGYEKPFREAKPFRSPHTELGFSILDRVDFLAFHLIASEVLILECKDASWARPDRLLGAIMQLTIYLRYYQMAQNSPSRQLFFRDIDPHLVKSKDDWKLTGALALPARIELRVLDRISQELAEVQLCESDLQIWELVPDEEREFTEEEQKRRADQTLLTKKQATKRLRISPDHFDAVCRDEGIQPVPQPRGKDDKFRLSDVDRLGIILHGREVLWTDF